MLELEGIEVDASIIDILHLLKEQLNAQGIELLRSIKDAGDNVMISCPYHKGGQERRPSAGVKKVDGTFHCFACEEVHSLPEVISHCFGENDGGAYGYKWLLQNYISVSKEERRDVELDLVRGEDFSDSFCGADSSRHSYSHGNSVSKDVHVYVGEEELDKYRVVHPYWAKRGITNDDVIELFDLGYDKETDCITFPVRDVNGNCLFVARRSVKTKFFNYPAGAEKPLYGLYEYLVFHSKFNKYLPQKFEDIIVCESMLDALSFWCAGKFAVALNGLGNELQFEQLRDLPCRHIILATDMDKSGMDARERIKKNVPNKIITEYFFPKGKKDANECTAEELMSLEEVL